MKRKVRVVTRGAAPAAWLFFVHTAAFIPASAAWGQQSPTSYRLSRFACELYEPSGQTILQVVGDSINATNTADRMQVGYRDEMDWPFNGWVVHADSGNSDIGYMNAQGAMSVNNIVIPGEEFSFGASAISPVRTRDAAWSADIAFGGTLSDASLIAYNCNSMNLGNPFAGATPMSARLIFFEGPNQLSGFVAAGFRAGQQAETKTYTRPQAPSLAVQTLDVVIPAGPGNPILRLRSDATTAESTPGANALTLLGVRMRTTAATGVQVQFISHGGWKTVDHVSPSNFTDDALRQYYAATGAPTRVMLWIGQNQTTQESNAFSGGDWSVYKSNVQAIISRHDSVIESLGKPRPRWLLVAPYKTGYYEETHLMMARALFELSLDDPDVSFLNLYQIAGGETFDKDAYLSDGVHPNAAGVHYLASLMNSQMRWVMNCPCDVDESGFVDFDDFNQFVDTFVDGLSDADYDQSGYVDFDDFNYFVTDYELGC